MAVRIAVSEGIKPRSKHDVLAHATFDRLMKHIFRDAGSSNKGSAHTAPHGATGNGS